jgi:hypothetical protein
VTVRDSPSESGTLGQQALRSTVPALHLAELAAVPRLIIDDLVAGFEVSINGRF